MPLQPRKHIAELASGVHGGFDFIEMEKLGLDPEEIIDFSVSTNPAGAPPGLVKPVSVRDLSKYPDSCSVELRRAIARKTNLVESCVLVGNGSTELIRLAVQAYLAETDRALILGPTYGEYETACRIAGAEVIKFNARQEVEFKPDIRGIIATIEQEQPKMIFLCNPNNPTGQYLLKEDVVKILEAAPDSLVVLDEAYAAFVEKRWNSASLIGEYNLILVRSMTKDYCIAGLRLGYALAKPEIIDILLRICPPWNVNVVAQRAGLAALQQDDYLMKSREAMIFGRRYLMGELGRLSFYSVPSAVNFFMVKVSDAAEMRTKLLEKGILVRDCTSFGLPEFIRIATGTKYRNRRLIAALREIRHDQQR